MAVADAKEANPQQQLQNLDFEQQMLNAFNMIKGGQLDTTQYKLPEIEKSVIKLLFLENRRIHSVDIEARNAAPYFQIPQIGGLEDLIQF